MSRTTPPLVVARETTKKENTATRRGTFIQTRHTGYVAHAAVLHIPTHSLCRVTNHTRHYSELSRIRSTTATYDDTHITPLPTGESTTDNLLEQHEHLRLASSPRPSPSRPSPRARASAPPGGSATAAWDPARPRPTSRKKTKNIKSRGGGDPSSSISISSSNTRRDEARETTQNRGSQEKRAMTGGKAHGARKHSNSSNQQIEELGTSMYTRRKVVPYDRRKRALSTPVRST